ncbi:hypothetical protein NIES2135_61370 (plasmid) [Leptolyngbya boryana NIES-2135]|jgi:murein endopeptidase|uniref:Uncharacterized protein n=1 Tax=Leptolyngbya boryana NIES-2135 TaxID=1973484 RepID=A0A1Z4JRC4_LEPBY|nr:MULTISPECIES: hypothetical protein [Leptolyngbya]BAY59260.1 hypothetical protein NIES2135_61370 [Leptolyngbya boryana NIES-2135]MBD2372849.1 hypothetical protein [Leptolyngbya sp. FACHB-238]MBD2397398.1 hypothetical protein [Leptolyngbya sp. FACHB-239]MBD2403797.1 hypothetical protein [Leptolyngbya sp. FACHB-402]ULP33453.1 hypothetical protein MCP04_30455 [Leptolyngbya boryana IU 594]
MTSQTEYALEFLTGDDRFEKLVEMKNRLRAMQDQADRDLDAEERLMQAMQGILRSFAMLYTNVTDEIWSSARQAFVKEQAYFGTVERFQARTNSKVKVCVDSFGQRYTTVNGRSID